MKCGSKLSLFCLTLMAGALLMFGFGCGTPEPPELKQGAAVVGFYLAPINYSRLSFLVVFPNGTPKQYVSWFFSQMGKAEWPPSESDAEVDPTVREESSLIGIPLLPKGVRFVHTMPDPIAGKQIVVKWNDDKGTIIIEGYLDPAQLPVLIRERELPRNIQPDEIAKAVAQSHLDLGVSSQAF